MTPMTRGAQDGTFTASLSIRRGSGTQTHDRIYTFTPEFATSDCALHYAAEQGQCWLHNPMALA